MPQLYPKFLLRLLSDSVKHLESQIAELERESERMARAQEAQRAATLEVEAMAAKKVEDISKDISKKVCRRNGCSLLQSSFISLLG